jgi:excisionase family DNA binding protein
MEKLKENPRIMAPAALLTRTELQHLLKFSARTITKLVASGGLPRPIRVGQSYRWRTSDINRFIEQQG